MNVPAVLTRADVWFLVSLVIVIVAFAVWVEFGIRRTMDRITSMPGDEKSLEGPWAE